MSDEKQENAKTINSIYDFESYLETYENDLCNARSEIIISSPTLSRNKIFNFLSLTKKLRADGVKVSVVTWHPDSYRYGNDENRIFLMETLRNAGIHLELVDDNCERYTIIDREIVWYGTLNFLSKEDIDDSIIRLVDKNIADELLNISFDKESKAKEYGISL